MTSAAYIGMARGTRGFRRTPRRAGSGDSRRGGAKVVRGSNFPLLAGCSLLVDNKDADPEAYRAWQDVYRPSHGDYTYEAKYGLRAWAGGGRSSARETVARVIAGDVARQVLATLGSVEVVAWVDRLHEVEASVDVATVSLASVEASPLRCPDEAASARMVEAVRGRRAGTPAREELRMGKRSTCPP